MKWAGVHNAGAFYRCALMKRLGLFAFRTIANQGLSVLLQDELQWTSPTDLQNGATRNRLQQEDLTTVPSSFTATAKTQLHQNSLLNVTLWDLSVYPWKIWLVDAQRFLKEWMVGAQAQVSRERHRKEHNALTYFLKFWNFASLQRWSVGYVGAPLGSK